MIWPLTPKQHPTLPRPGPAPNGNDALARMESRLRRIETRLCVLMQHQGLDPYEGAAGGHHPTQAGTPPVR